MKKALFHYIALFLIYACAFVFFATPADAQPKIDNVFLASNASFKDTNAVVVELFTSQSCPFCPPAEERLRKLALRPDIITLEYHIDYWDARGKDEFSNPQWTDRQLFYNQNVFNSSRLFTPQMIINGEFQGNGAEKKVISTLIEQALSDPRKKPIIHLQTKKTTQTKKLYISVEAEKTEPNTSLFFIRFLRETETRNRSGYLRSNYNTVTHMSEIGLWPENGKNYIIPVQNLKEHENCAIILQNTQTMRILAARFCTLSH